MLSAIGTISAGRELGTLSTHVISWDKVISQALSRVIPCNFGALARSFKREPWQSGHASSFKNFSTRFIPFFIFYLREGIFYRINSIKISEIQFTALIGALGLIKNMLFHRRAMINDLLFFFGQVPKRKVCPDAIARRRLSSVTTSEISRAPQHLHLSKEIHPESA